jgi:hypothetical protein
VIFLKTVKPMNENSALPVRSKVHPVDLFLIVAGATVLGAGFDLFKSALFYSGIGFAAGCALAALAWLWPKIGGAVLLVLSIPVMFEGLVFALYTLGKWEALVSLWGSAAFLAGGLGVVRRKLTARRPGRHIAIQSCVTGGLAAVFLLYFLILWPPQGKTILLNLPILKQAERLQVHAEAGGIWAGYWMAPQENLPQALASIQGPLVADGWRMVDTSLHGFGIPLVSAQRGAYSLEVIYEPGAPKPYWSTGAYMAAYVRRAKARVFSGFDIPR